MGSKIMFTGLGERIERLRTLWACLTGVFKGCEDDGKRGVKVSDAVDERNMEPSSSSAGIGWGIVEKNGLKACACAVDLQEGW